MKYIILGAGKAGKSIARDLLQRNREIELILVDDDRQKIGSNWMNIPIQGPIEAYLSHCSEMHTTPVIIALPSVEKKTITKIYSQLQTKRFTDIKILPSLTSNLKDAKTDLLETIDLNELLLRNKLKKANKTNLAYLRNKTVLITGAGGSIGEVLAEHVLLSDPSHLIVLDNNEPALVNVYKRLKHIAATQGTAPRITPVLLPIEQKALVDDLFTHYPIEYVFHTAAYKHVDMVEINPKMGVLVNIIGTKHLLESASDNGTSQFIHISTDKVVEPSNIYGYSKLVAELLVRTHQSSHMNTVVTRFGNVLGSSGSVIPIFVHQIARGGPITITDLRCKRYFMTIPEACSLILHASYLGSTHRTNKLFVLEMGQQIPIIELAQRLCTLYGLELHKDISVQEIGLREGEKLEERLFFSNEHEKKSSIEYIWEVTPKTKQMNTPSKQQESVRASIKALLCRLEQLLDERHSSRDTFYKLFESYLQEVL